MPEGGKTIDLERLRRDPTVKEEYLREALRRGRRDLLLEDACHDDWLAQELVKRSRDREELIELTLLRFPLDHPKATEQGQLSKFLATLYAPLDWAPQCEWYRNLQKELSKIKTGKCLRCKGKGKGWTRNVRGGKPWKYTCGTCQGTGIGPITTYVSINSAIRTLAKKGLLERASKPASLTLPKYKGKEDRDWWHFRRKRDE